MPQAMQYHGEQSCLRRNSPRPIAACLVLAAAAALLSRPSLATPLGQAQLPVVYGEDDRVEVFEHPDATLQQAARNSVVALMSPRRLLFESEDTVELQSQTLNQWYGLCEGQKFAEQPSASFCTGVLIDDDLVATAGHCLGSTRAQANAECRDMALVFGYLYDSDDQLSPLRFSNTFRCQQVVTWRLRTFGTEEDYAIIQLDRPVAAPLTPAPLAEQLPEVGQPVAFVGFHSGLPAKIDSGGAVVAVGSDDDFFLANCDTFGGASGGPLFNEAGEVLGLLSRGARDWDSSGGCTAARLLTSGGDAFQPSGPALSALCDAQWPSARLCGQPPSCGDGACSGAERSAQDCPADCSPKACGDLICQLDEPLSCPEDCGVALEVPAQWTCDPEYYGDKRGCDCDCGALDVDCGIAGQPVLNCSSLAICGPSGECQREPLSGEPSAPNGLRANNSTESEDEGILDLQDLLAAEGDSDGASQGASCSLGSPGRRGRSTEREFAWVIVGAGWVLRRRRRRSWGGPRP